MLGLLSDQPRGAGKDSVHDQFQRLFDKHAKLAQRMDRLEAKVDLLVDALIPGRFDAGLKREASSYAPSPRADKLRTEVANAREESREDARESVLAASAAPAPAVGSAERGEGAQTACEIKWERSVSVPAIYQHRGCTVAETHRRALTLEQFEDFFELIEAVLLFYREVDQFGVAVTASNVNMYRINDIFVKPLTFRDSCSFMELVADGPQDPLWFISHWWGTPFKDSMRMLTFHAKRRDIDLEDCYWMCTFANNQHNLSELVEPDVTHTPFAIAILSESCVGTIVLLDEKKATPFTRIWCILEDFVSLTLGMEKARPQLYDVATIIPRGECESSDGSLNERCAGILLDMGNGQSKDAKSDARNPDAAWFPSHVSYLGTSVDVTKANATSPSDRENILRFIKGREEEVNVAMRRRFAMTALYQGATKDGDLERVQSIMSSGLLGSREETIKKINAHAIVAGLAEYQQGNPRQLEVLRFLLRARCDPNAPDCSADPPRYPIRNALDVNNFDAVRLLVSSKADIHKKHADGSAVVRNAKRYTKILNLFDD